jgi:hypothetical protein
MLFCLRNMYGAAAMGFLFAYGKYGDRCMHPNAGLIFVVKIGDVCALKT